MGSQAWRVISTGWWSTDADVGAAGFFLRYRRGSAGRPRAGQARSRTYHMPRESSGYGGVRGVAVEVGSRERRFRPNRPGPAAPAVTRPRAHESRAISTIAGRVDPGPGRWRHRRARAPE